MDQYRPYLIAGRRFDLDRHRYLIGPYSDDCEELVLYKAAQMGASELLISWILYMASEHDATGFYVLPTDKLVSDFATARLNPALEPAVSPKLAALVTGASGGRRGADRITLKRVGNRFVYFRGGQIQDAKIGEAEQAAQLMSVDSDTLVLDELDQMDPRVEAYGRARLEHSEIAKVRIASTPTIAGFGIHAAYERSDKRRYFQRCQHCGERQPLSMANLILEYDALERPLRWHGQADDSPYLACLKCAKPLERGAPGEWVPEYSIGRSVHGYHISGLLSDRKGLQGIIDGLSDASETKRQQTINQKLGETYEARETERLTETILDRGRRPFALGAVPNEETCIGIDVGAVLNIIIRAKLPDGSRPLRWAAQVESFDEAERLIRLYNGRVVVIDALPETRLARSLAARFSRLRVWLAYFAESEKGSKHESPATWNAKELSVNLDRTHAIDTALALTVNASRTNEDGEPLPGNTLPQDARAIRDYYAQMLAPIRTERQDRQGNKVFVYVNARPDHYALAETYCAMAFLCPYQAWARGSG